MMDIILYWNAVALEANRESHTVENGEQRGPTLSARALGIVHLAMHDAFFAIEGGHDPYMSLPENPPGTAVPPGDNTVAAVSAAACTALSALYPSQRPKFEAALLGVDILATNAAVSNAFGRAVARQMIAKLMIKAGEPGVSDLGYEASFAHARHRQDPDNPGQGFYGPFYGDNGQSAGGDHIPFAQRAAAAGHVRIRCRTGRDRREGRGHRLEIHDADARGNADRALLGL